ncbi:sirohydrochlorin chelatase [Tepidibacillus sp. LV47]|uniref:sirohydrochlorin chelatase n=1 Tax=Tepidibacillus sp. LV47 TaxID=3398228 RepID=UPI003AAB96B0
MEAILFVAHGSRDAEGNEEVFGFTEKVAQKIREIKSVPIIETCFLELTTPTVAEGIDQCIRQGATKVALVPIILFSAGHAKIHIPYEIDQAKGKYPDVTFTYGRPIAIHEVTLQILSDRLKEIGFQGESGEQRKNEAILLVGRGSSDPDANSDLYKIMRLLWERTPVKWVEPAFMGITEPTFTEGIERCIATGAKNIYILPFFLFTGILIKRMDQMIEHYQQLYPNRKIKRAPYLGLDHKLIDVLTDRAFEALEGKPALNCDLCKYRLNFIHHSHHHDHHDHVHHHHGHHHHNHQYEKHTHLQHHE